MKLFAILIYFLFLFQSQTLTLNWSQLKKILKQKNYTQLKRSAQEQQIYKTFQKKFKEKKLTMTQHIKLNILGFKGHPLNHIYLIKAMFVDNKKILVYVSGHQKVWRKFIKRSTYCSKINGIREGSNYALLSVNNFPYDLYKINHWVVWTSYQFSHSTQITVMKQIISKNIQILMYENLPAQKSVPEINHFQLFWRKKE